MRKLILILFILAHGFSSNAQKNYTIMYSYFTGVEVANGKPTYNNKLQLSLNIYSDTLSFCRFWSHKPNISKKLNVISRDSHHGTLHYLKSDSILEVSAMNKKKYFIVVSQSYNWKITNDTITIIGIKCIKAKSDSGVIAWFAPSIPINAGPNIYYGLPGLILQVTDSKYHLLMIAESIQKVVPPLDYPNNIRILSVEKAREEAKKNR